MGEEERSIHPSSIAPFVATSNSVVSRSLIKLAFGRPSNTEVRETFGGALLQILFRSLRVYPAKQSLFACDHPKLVRERLFRFTVPRSSTALKIYAEQGRGSRVELQSDRRRDTPNEIG